MTPHTEDDTAGLQPTARGRAINLVGSALHALQHEGGQLELRTKTLHRVPVPWESELWCWG